MAPAAPAATGAASPAVTKGGGKVAARSVRLGLPALPPLPGLSLAAQGQTRAASSLYKRLARDVVAMAAGEPAAPQAANEELTEFVDALKKEAGRSTMTRLLLVAAACVVKWDRIEDKYAVTTLAVAATLGMWSAGGVVSVY
ncbi:Protein CURVATURE THYLAKOID 1B chloroplastic [Zea mays]|uniref:Protein CURVATURE THYLAKOID 1B chloroplastic n=1 Tax=Zea mays TaxID=4577 RepID=A0A1D6K7J1_MAIZE|nr:Protein CURVATURE THYLAKOID 1B chloroplastic [Zea mays]